MKSQFVLENRDYNFFNQICCDDPKSFVGNLFGSFTWEVRQFFRGLNRRVRARRRGPRYG